MDASGAPATDELTGVRHGPQRDAIYEPEKTARRKAHNTTGLLSAQTHHVRLHNFTQRSRTIFRRRGFTLLEATHSTVEQRPICKIVPRNFPFLWLSAQKHAAITLLWSFYCKYLLKLVLLDSYKH